MSEALVDFPRAGPSPRRAIACVCGASACFALASCIVKALAAEIPTIEIVLFRSLVASLLLLPMLGRHGGLAALRTRRPWGHAGRTVSGFIGMFTAFYGVAHLPLATVTALGFAMPLFLSLLSIPLLGERVGVVRGAAVAAGLVGVSIMLRPWNSGVDALPAWPVAIVLGGVVAWALAMISIRKMGAAGERNITIVLWFSLGCAVLSAVLVVPVWVMPGPLELLGLVAIGVVSTAAQLLMTEGYRSGETTLVAPFEYGAILYTTALGLLIWGEVPDVWTLVGIVILVGAGLVVWWRA
jgi:drug/metabolite transporter (DMT)-like permease